jgi:alanine racemase
VQKRTRLRDEKKKIKVNRGPAAEIDLSALRHNLEIIRKIVKKVPVIAVVKADAYGHGAAEISRELLTAGVSCLAVAFTGEARTLREAGIKSRILVLFDTSDIDDYFRYDLVPVIHDLQTAAAFSKEALRRGLRMAVHAKVDTGMGRIGFRPESAGSDMEKIAGMRGIEVEGLMSHFSEADLTDKTYADLQIGMFRKIRAEVSERLGRPVMAHMANSAAVISLEEAFFDAVRPGLILYGYSPFRDDRGLMAVMKVRTRILVVRNLPAGTPVSYGRTFITKRDSRIAVVPVGYADGYNRLFSNNSEMLVRGRRVPVAGRVCMDLTMLDVTEVDGVSEGDEVVILGGQGDDAITAVELSSRINTIPYDILTSLGSRARREYVEGR